MADVGPRASIVVVAYGQRPLLERLLESIERHTPTDHEVIVVDNQSPDDTADWLRRHHDEVRLIEAGENLGYGQGANLGVAAADSDTIVLLNSDIVVTAGWLEPLLETAAGPAVGVVAPVSIGADGAMVEAGAAVTSDGHVHIVATAEGQLPRAVAHVSASCWVFRRSWFLRLAGFDPGFGLGYYEDLDLTTAARAQGWLVMVDPRSRVQHDVGGSFPAPLARQLSHRNHHRALNRWFWERDLAHSRRDDPTASVRGRVLILGLGEVLAGELAARLSAQHVASAVVHANSPAEIAEVLRQRPPLDDVVVTRAPLPAADRGGLAPRAEWCTPDEVGAALERAGILLTTTPPATTRPLLHLARGRSAP